MNTSENNKAVLLIMDSLRTLVRALSLDARNTESEIGITGAQRFVLQTLKSHTELSINQLAELTHTHQSTVSTVVNKLVAKGLVMRREGLDRRFKILTITSEGRKKLHRKRKTIQDRLIESLQGLTPREQVRLNALLTAMIAGAGMDCIRPELFFESENPS